MLDSLAQIALAAGQKILGFYKSETLATRAKADQSPVTEADLAAHHLILAALQQLTPTIPIISEESADDRQNVACTLRTAERFWLVDPLDGTRDFIAGTDDFTVNIALVDGKKPQLAALYAPARGDLYLAEMGQGAWRSSKGAPLTRISARPAPADGALVVLVSRFHKSDENERLTATLPRASIRTVGSALKYAVIAAGEADLALRYTPTNLWDTAAPECVLAAAGGLTLDLSGKPLDYRNESLVNPPLIACGDPTFDWHSRFARTPPSS